MNACCTGYGLDNPLGKTKKPTPIMIIRKSGTGLLRTCKQVNEKVTPILYGVNTFTFSERMQPVAAESCLDALLCASRLRWHLVTHNGTNDIVQMEDFFNLIDASNRAKIRHINIEIAVLSLFQQTPFTLLTTLASPLLAPRPRNFCPPECQQPDGWD